MASVKRALISVSDKTGVVEFAQKLHGLDVEILSTGGTAELLKQNGIPVVQVSDYTGFPEMMDGRIKTLHPKVHGGILARRDREEHRQSMEEHGVKSIDLVAINLYPFENTIAKKDCTLAEAIENIDIGGPAMVRSAAKNFNDVTVIVRPQDYATVLSEMQSHDGSVTRETRLRLSRDAYAHTARYDALISRYLSGRLDEGSSFPAIFQLPFEKIQELRYGENPHQSAAFYRDPDAGERDIVSARQIQGKELSFNNIIDLEAAWQLAMDFESGSAVVIKHTNPSGVAVGDDQLETFIKAREADPVSAFGGIIGFNRPVSARTAEEILKNFVEAVIAPDYEEEALKLFAGKKNIRVMRMSVEESAFKSRVFDLKRVGGGLLVQDKDILSHDPASLKVVTQKQPGAGEMEDLLFAWVVAKHVKSNAIVYARDKETLGIGAGQMSRVDSARLAVQKARQTLKGCVMASDAFFPFRDSVDEAAKSGISAIIQPGGSIRDDEVVRAANEHGMSMFFTGIRHFKH
ncbi:phosphoribosylaminoimidazolecarboxamide formyltransferase [Candidatus Nitromaritima sp. SCGC AAA799-A02]|nr:phosphoribosylaminoimidazolecarboxamide formyltransferase [Candidatus Nitromaritima sp. SCGC AAA799-C22]KMP11988.1 phosphoribosylaminoimidazolecarboxamide formyltransferase [Candidatus Nitromaritima sp. SCGC AAA799-A02]